MPRIGRGNAPHSPSHEQTGNATPPRSPDPGGSGAAGRRERHGLLGMFTRPFRGSRSSTRASGDPSASPSHEREQASASRAAPRTGAALLQRSPALSRSHAEEVMARLEHGSAQTPGRATESSPSSPARGTLAPQPARQSPHEAQAARIVDELRNAGIDLSGMHRDLSTLMHRRQIAMTRRAYMILVQHFPTLRSHAEISPTDPLAVALERALEHATVAGQIRSAFNDLRTISKDEAKRMGFKDAATHSADEATHCMFGGPLSTSDPDQRVIALVPVPSNPANAAFSADVNKKPEFMDLANLARYLETRSLHPVTRQPLDVSNIRDYAFRIA